ncbi:FAD/NAD-binding domain-containing protein [Dentipellis sp. KUC8613]|nr:FAD/NAD-binding domain-containing protein [Dentipellis sp. KUC8613]
MRVAVVGSGVSGLGATWLLNEHSEHEVHLYEADSRPGGHANTVPFAMPGKEAVEVDSGFIVFNPSTYPNFLRFLRKYTSVEILPTEMTFSVSRDHGAFEWSGKNPGTVFAQRKRLLDPRMWRMVYDVTRFNACATKVLSEDCEDLSIGEYLEREGYSDGFRDDYLIPMTAAIWSTPPDVCALDFPAKTLVRFMENHHLLQLTARPSWLTIKGGSKQYVNTILDKLPKSQLHLSTPVVSIHSEPAADGSSGFKIVLKTAAGATETYDHVILACHSDQALRMLSEPTEEEKRILGGFRWSQNEVVVHADEDLMPRDKSTWSCWNYLTFTTQDSRGGKKANVNEIAMTYWMNDLQHIPLDAHGPVFVTINAPRAPAPSKFLSRIAYAHPVLDAQAVRSQADMPFIQGTRGISYAGAWMRYGFHEDGFTAGLQAAAALIPGAGKGLPFEIVLAEREVERWRDRVQGAFEVLEAWGVRAAVGALLSFFLAVLRMLLGVRTD